MLAIIVTLLIVYRLRNLAIKTLPIHPLELLLLNLIKYFVNMTLLRAIFIQKLAAQDTKRAPRIRIDAKQRNLIALDHARGSEIRPIAADRDDQRLTFRVLGAHRPFLSYT